MPQYEPPKRLWLDRPRHGAMTNVYVEEGAPNKDAVAYVRADAVLGAAVVLLEQAADSISLSREGETVGAEKLRACAKRLGALIAG